MCGISLLRTAPFSTVTGIAGKIPPPDYSCSLFLFFYFAATTPSRRFSEWFVFKYSKIEPDSGVGVREGPGLNS
jgi:hypothetical protein